MLLPVSIFETVHTVRNISLRHHTAGIFGLSVCRCFAYKLSSTGKIGIVFSSSLWGFFIQNENDIENYT